MPETSIRGSASALEALPPLPPPRPRPRLRLVVVSALLGLAVLAYLFLFIEGGVGFALERRATVVAALLVVGFAQAVATLVFQTVTQNRVLTPSIMGLDSVHVLVQTALVAAFGGSVLGRTDGVAEVLVQTAVMVVFATLLFRWLFNGRFASLRVLLLVGVTLGMAFDSLSGFLQRVLSPTDYDLLSLRLFARISAVDASALPVAAAVCAAVGAFVRRRARCLDVLHLGRDVATNLGVDHQRELTRMLVAVSVLIALSTALAGPMVFFGFVTVTVARQVLGGDRHVHLLPMAVLLGALLLVTAQFTVEHVFSAAGMLTVVIDIIGGAAFLALLLRRGTL